ncbi:hypothetical protein [Kitasatospora sp. NPDC057223]|uniref:hypothetical protein n=1 Tax=Kitasatospora sp. NPDC057223 TaxID=3346055 RepID=UPI0036289F14
MVNSVIADGGGGTTPGDPIGWVTGGVAAAAVTAAKLVATYGAQSVKVEVETLVEFKKRAEELLSALQSSPATVSQLSEFQLHQDNLGTGFAESSDLMRAYERAFNNLPQLISALGNQIDGMSAALGTTAAGYGATEEQQESAANAVYQQGGNSYSNLAQGGYGGRPGPVTPTPATPVTRPAAGDGNVAF